MLAPLLLLAACATAFPSLSDLVERDANGFVDPNSEGGSMLTVSLQTWSLVCMSERAFWL